MKLGASDLLNNHFDQPSLVAEAYVKGELSRLEEPFALSVVTQNDLDKAFKAVPRDKWKLEFRVAALEREIYGS